MSTITREEVLKMDWKSIQAAIKNPETSAQMQQLLRDRVVVSRVSELMLEAKNREDEREKELDAQLNRVVPPSTEQLAAEAAAMAATPEPVAVVEPVVAEPVAPAVPDVPSTTEQEDAEFKKVGLTVTRDANGKITYYNQEDQAVGGD